MTVLVTGAAGFIGYHVSQHLLDRGDSVVGVDNLNDYYSVDLKRARLDGLEGRSGFTFHRADIADRDAMAEVVERHGNIDRVVHLAAQAGVRHSLENPFVYAHSNLMGHLVILELCRNLDALTHLVYASSSSVYGGNTKLPFSVDDNVDRPISLYAATKRADELMTFSYSDLYGIPATGLRFFTVYGPWGRPDMAAFLFTDAIVHGRPIRVFNNGDMERDFTYIDDIINGVIACLDHPPEGTGGQALHRLYNIGNNHPEKLTRLIQLIERALNRKAEMILEPIQPGDVPRTYADIEGMRRDFGFEPSTSLEQGVERFVDWYRSYHRLLPDAQVNRGQGE